MIWLRRSLHVGPKARPTFTRRSRWVGRALGPTVSTGLGVFCGVARAKVSALLGFILLAALPLHAQDSLQDLLDADQLRITARLDPAEPVIATQRTKLVIEIATANWFTGGTRLGDLQVRNAIVLQRQTFGNNSNRRINGQTWAVQGWEFEIFPRYPGTYEIPGVDVSVEVADGSGGSIRGGTTTAPLTLEATAPPVEPPAATWVVSPDLSIRTTWDLPRDELMAGDARQRTITITAEELPSMVLPSIAYGEVAGMGIYPQPARRDDQTNRGQSTATFTQTVSYFCEAAGSYTIPGFELAWWNPDTERWQVETVPSETFAVAANPNAVVDPPETGEATGSPYLFFKRFILISGALFVIALLARTVIRIARGLTARRRARGKSAAQIERESWRALQHALRGNDPEAVVTALYHWRDHLPQLTGAPTLAQLAQSSHQTRLDRLLNSVLASAFATAGNRFEQRAELTQSLHAARKALLHQQKSLGSAASGSTMTRLN